MKEYKFLLKPIFYVFSLLFATWLVIEIEKISPSDFGDKNAATIHKKVPEVFQDNKKYLQNLCVTFKAGAIDSAALHEKLTFFLKTTKIASTE